jgi:hypothetical protein
MRYPQTKVHEQQGRRWWHECPVCDESFATHLLYRVHLSDSRACRKYIVNDECLGFGGEFECAGLMHAHPAPRYRRPNGKAAGQHLTGAEIRQKHAAERLTKVEAILDAIGLLFPCDYQGCAAEVVGVEFAPKFAQRSSGVVTVCADGHRVKWSRREITRPRLITDGKDAWPDESVAFMLQSPTTPTAERSPALEQEDAG